MTAEKLKIKPYARLLTMLGEQLIKNEKVALIEIIKNSYDADADWVRINFSGFEENFEVTPVSKIIIEDNGEGMTEDIIKKQWMHPAAPGKKKRKEKKSTTTKGRVIQGEKGIGRYALLKLGKVIKVVTRPEKDPFEYHIIYDFTKYDNEFTRVNGEDADISLDDITVLFEKKQAEIIVEKDIDTGKGIETRSPFGTRIEISELSTVWSEKKVQSVFTDLQKLQGVIPDHNSKKKTKADFLVSIFLNKKYKSYGENLEERLSFLIDERAVFRIHGDYFEKQKEFVYILNDQKVTLKLEDLKGLSLFKNTISKDFDIDKRTSACGDFNFTFYVFDFDASAPGKYKLDKPEKELIKPHRIYLFRDDVRVYPYGDIDDDWLHIDQYRGTISAGAFLSNDQVMGKVNISHDKNPNLVDKTNREGLIEQGTATSDFIGLLQLFLADLRRGEYKRYVERNKSSKEIDIYKGDHVQKEFEGLRKSAEGNSTIEQKIASTEKLYLAERNYLIKRAETTEELAGVGLSVEASYHDVFSFLEKVLRNLDDLIRSLTNDSLDLKELEKELTALRGMISFSVDQMRDVQLMFSSTKQRRKNTEIKEVVDKVLYIYRRLLNREGISCEIKQVGSPLVAKTTDAVLLQLLINLFDNSIYWLNVKGHKNKEILITLDGNNNELIFSDNGPGIKDEDKLYIFTAFYSGKGQEGRGLGLYIAQQLLERQGYHISLASSKSEKILPGVNFIVSFVFEE